MKQRFLLLVGLLRACACATSPLLPISEEWLVPHGLNGTTAGYRQYIAEELERNEQGGNLESDIAKCTEMPHSDQKCMNALNCMWGGEKDNPDMCSALDPKPEAYGFTDKHEKLDLSDKSQVAAYTKGTQFCSRPPPRQLGTGADPNDQTNRIFLMEDALWICDVEEGAKFNARTDKSDYMEQNRGPACTWRISLNDVTAAEWADWNGKGLNKDDADDAPEFRWRLRIELKEGKAPPTDPPDQIDAEGTIGRQSPYFKFAEKARHGRPNIYIGCGMLLNHWAGDEKKRPDAGAPGTKTDLAIKACTKRGEAIQDNINTILHTLDGSTAKEEESMRFWGAMIEVIGDEVRGAVMNAVAANKEGSMQDKSTAFMEGYITTPTVGQGGQIGASFEQLGTPHAKLFSASLACASGVTMTIATGGTGSAALLGVASSCMMLLSRGIQGVIEFFAGKKLVLPARPKYEDELEWTKAYVDEIRHLSEKAAGRYVFSAISVETLREVMCTMSVMRDHARRAVASTSDEIAAITRMEEGAQASLKEVRVQLNQVLNVEQLRLLMLPFTKEDPSQKPQTALAQAQDSDQAGGHKWWENKNDTFDDWKPSIEDPGFWIKFLSPGGDFVQSCDPLNKCGNNGPKACWCYKKRVCASSCSAQGMPGRVTGMVEGTLTKHLKKIKTKVDFEGRALAELAASADSEAIEDTSAEADSEASEATSEGDEAGSPPPAPSLAALTKPKEPND